MIGAVSSVYRNLSPLASSPKVPIILGRCAQRTIAAQKYVPLVKRYREAKERKYGDKKILIRRVNGDSMLSKLASGKSFAVEPGDSGKKFFVKLTDVVALSHQGGLGRVPERHVIEADQKLADDLGGLLNDLASNELAKRLKRK